MSIRGEANKMSGDVRRAINSIANKGITHTDGTLRGTKKIVGYVCNIHEDGELAGTIDVQEYFCDQDDFEVKGVGHHEGVLLSAIQNNEDGVRIVPMLYSEVVIVQNPYDGEEYVLMYSHAKRVEMTAHSLKGEDDGCVKLGVTETEAFVEEDEGIEKDYNELEPTKNKTLTIYTATSITDHITSSSDEDGLKQEKTAVHKVITVGKTKITIDGSNVNIETDGNISFTVGSTKITEQNGKVEIKTDSATIDSTNCEVKGDNVKVQGSSVTITGGTLTTKGVCAPDMNGPFNGIMSCPMSGAPHCGSIVSGT